VLILTSELHEIKQGVLTRAGGVPQVVELLPSKCEALSSNPNTKYHQKKKKKRTCTNIEQDDILSFG
jgi:hypothetical protein